MFSAFGSTEQTRDKRHGINIHSIYYMRERLSSTLIIFPFGPLRSDSALELGAIRLTLELFALSWGVQVGVLGFRVGDALLLG
jgi:hypothetical protein